MEGINWNAIALGLAFFANAVSAAAWVYTWNVNRNRATDKDMRRLGERLTVVESTVGAMPSTNAIHKVELELAEAVGELKRLNEKMDGHGELFQRLEDMVRRHEEHLLSRD